MYFANLREKDLIILGYWNEGKEVSTRKIRESIVKTSLITQYIDWKLFMKTEKAQQTICSHNPKRNSPLSRPSFVFHIVTSHLICGAYHMTDFCMKCSTELEWVKRVKQKQTLKY